MTEKEYIWMRANGAVKLYMDGMEFKFSGYGVSVLASMRANGCCEGGTDLHGWFLVGGADVEAYIK